MVLELEVPHKTTFDALRLLLPVFISYVLSFLYVGIYWNNHHHLLQAIHHVNGRVLWANLHWLFWISLFPFATAWMGENKFAALPVAFYGVILLFAAIAYFILTQTLIAHHGKDSPLALALGNAYKEKISLVIYVVALPLAFVNSWVAFSLYILIAGWWLIPDGRIERTLST
jgi:uncharacterized membrane protein